MLNSADQLLDVVVDAPAVPVVDTVNAEVGVDNLLGGDAGGLLNTGDVVSTVGDVLGGDTSGDTDLVIDTGLGLGDTATTVPTLEVPLDPVETIVGDIDLHVDAAADLLNQSDPSGPLASSLDLGVDGSTLPVVDSATTELSLSDLFSTDASSTTAMDTGADSLPQPEGDVSTGLTSVADNIQLDTNPGMGLF